MTLWRTLSVNSISYMKWTNPRKDRNYQNTVKKREIAWISSMSIKAIEFVVKQLPWRKYQENMVSALNGEIITILQKLENWKGGSTCQLMRPLYQKTHKTKQKKTVNDITRKKTSDSWTWKSKNLNKAL